MLANFNGTEVQYTEQSQFHVWDKELSVPESGEYFFALHDHQLREFNYEPRSLKFPALPSTRMLWGCIKEGDFLPMNKEAQFWLYELLAWATGGRLPDGEIEYYYYTPRFRAEEVRTTKDNPEARVKCTYGSLKWVWEDLLADHRGFTDTHAPDSSPGYADYILGRNLTHPPFKWKSLLTTGNIVKKEGVFNVDYVIEALDVTKPMPSVEWVVQNKPWLIGWATQTTNVRIDKSNWVVSKFPQVKLACREHGLPEVGTPFPIIGINNRNRIHKSHVMQIKNGAKYSPYIP